MSKSVRSGRGRAVRPSQVATDGDARALSRAVNAGDNTVQLSTGTFRVRTSNDPSRRIANE